MSAADLLPDVGSFAFWIMVMVVWFLVSTRKVPPNQVVAVFRLKRFYGVRGSGLAYGGLRGFARMVPIDLTEFFNRHPEFKERDRSQRTRLMSAVRLFLESKLMKRTSRHKKAYDVFMTHRAKNPDWPSKELIEFLEKKLVRKPSSETVTRPPQA